jgi:adenylate cyclase
VRKVFISYARQNKPDIEQLVEHLRVLGCDSWHDSSMHGGQDWWEEILRRIAECDSFIAIISRDALNSTACRREFDWAESLDKPVLPVAVEPPPKALPRRFSKRQIVDYSDREARDRAALTLAGGLATLPAPPGLPDPLPEPPAAPLSYLTDLVDLVSQAQAIDHDQQRQILNQLEPALRSVDPEERRGGSDILDMLSSRHDLYADIDRTITRLRGLSGQPVSVRSDERATTQTPPTGREAEPSTASPDAIPGGDVRSREKRRWGSLPTGDGDYGCGSPINDADTRAEYKQVTVLFADVVRSMDIASVVGAERLREIMAGLVDRAAVVVKHYGGTVDKFTGDGIMALFGAPVALEDHALRACRAALEIHNGISDLAQEVSRRDGVELQLRVGLNSGQVVAGDIGSGPFGYTAVGEQVGMAQRMESVAPPGGVMLSESTRRLVEGAAALGEAELVQIKGADAPVPACRLLGMGEAHRAVGRAESNLVGRRWEMAAVEGLLERAIDGHGAVVSVVGRAGIGKSRLVREVAAMAGRCGVEVFTTFCESHTSQVPFHAVARLLRAATGVEDLGGQAARNRVRAQVRDADPEDLVLFDDLLGIADPEVELPKIDPDARRRRLTALVNAASLARETPALYVIEDAHWVDEISESMLAEFLTVIPQTSSLVLVTYRPVYGGALTRVRGTQTIALTPLSEPETAALVAELLGPDPSVGAVRQTITERAAGNPFFAEEMVRELAERGVLRGQSGAYILTAEVGEVGVPVTLQATLAARIDRLDLKAKRTLSAAAVVGSRFSLDLLTVLGVEPVVDDLVAAQLIDQVQFTGEPEYVFHHPLICTVAYESQLKSDRAELHRRVAAAIEERDPASVDENAALIAEHLEAAGDLHAAFAWHMRAGMWLTQHELNAARASWQRARHVADRLPDTELDRAAMRTAPRTMLCVTACLAGGSIADTGFDELRDLVGATGDKASLAMGMAGLVLALLAHARVNEASSLASELTSLLESIGDPMLTLGLLIAALLAKYQVGEMAETLRLAQLMIDLADGDPRKGILPLFSPLGGAILLRGGVRCCLGDPRWRADFDTAARMVRAFDATARAVVLQYKYGLTIPHGVLLPDAAALHETAELLEVTQRSSDDFTLASARFARGLVLVAHDGPRRADGLALLAAAREAAVQERFTMITAAMVDTVLAEEKARAGDLDGSIDLSRAALEWDFASGDRVFGGPPTAVLVEALLRRGADTDLEEAQAAIDRLATVPTEPGFVLHDIFLLRLRALLARARGDEAAYRDFRDRYRDMAKTLGFEGHIAWAEAMP